MTPHVPVLLKETLKYWHAKEGGTFIDGTLGAGGHTRALLAADSEARCLGVDRDPNALGIARERLKEFGERAQTAQANYADLPEKAARMGFVPADGLLVDLGVSSMQLDEAARGFSFSKAGPLDMRMDPSRGETARELIRRLSVKDLARVIQEYGEEYHAKPIAIALKRAEAEGGLKDTAECAEVIARVVKARGKSKGGIHPATRTFQALRIAVNRELDFLERLLEALPGLLNRGGRAVFISFHSLEDRMVKEASKRWEKNCVCPPSFPKCVCGKISEFRVLTRKPVEASETEVAENPRSRSAKLRAVEKI